jgi:hypothetical protein
MYVAISAEVDCGIGVRWSKTRRGEVVSFPAVGGVVMLPRTTFRVRGIRLLRQRRVLCGHR